jgi:hypothetical protein
MLSPCLIWSETGRRVVLDGGVDVGFLPAVMAAGVLQARATEGGGEVVEELLHVGVVLLVPLAGMEQLCTGGSTGSSPALWEMMLRWSWATRKRLGSFRAMWGSWKQGQLGSRWIGKGCSTASRKRRRMVIAGSDAPAEIGLRLVAEEHE